MVKQYHSVEGFENDCTTPCLVGDVNPYEISQMLFSAGKSYRSTYNVDTTTLSETVESFTSTNESQVTQAIEDSLTLYTMEECYQNIYLSTNLQASTENGDGTKYQLKILIDEVGDTNNETNGTAVNSSLYRLSCKINKDGLADDPKFFVLSSDNSSLQVTNEEYYIGNEPLDVLSFGDDNNNNNNNNKSNANAREMNPNNTLYFHFYQVYTNAIYIKVLDDNNSYGFLKKDMTLVAEDDIYIPSSDTSNYSGFDNDLLNVNYYFIKPYQIPDTSLNIFLDSNIQVVGDNGEYVETQIKIEESYVSQSLLEFQYRITLTKDGYSDKLYAFTQSSESNKITTTDKCINTTDTDSTYDKYLFTFWQTLDDQFIICKMFKNNATNCPGSESGSGVDSVTGTTSFDLVGVCSNVYDGTNSSNIDPNETNCSSSVLYTVNKGTSSESFRSGVHCNISNTVFNIENLETLIEVIELSAKALLIEDLQQVYLPEVGEEISLGSGSASVSYTDNTLNLIIILKIVSVIIAAFIFFDLDTTRELPVKLFRLAFTMFFSEFYIIFQFLRYVVWGR